MKGHAAAVGTPVPPDVPDRAGDARAGHDADSDRQAPHPSDRPRFQENTAVLGMTVFVASWAMLFASLFFAYGALRVRAHVWPPADLPALPRVLPALATLALALSSVLLHLANDRARRRRDGRPSAWPLWGATALGAGFLSLQARVWQDLWAAGLRPASGPYASAFFGLTVFHALHVLVGLAALVFLSARAATAAGVRATFPARAAEPAGRPVALRLWSLYWHMVGAIWLVMFVLVYLV